MEEEIPSPPESWQPLSYVLEKRLESGRSMVSSHRIIVNRREWGVIHYGMAGIFLSVVVSVLMKGEMQFLHHAVLVLALIFFVAWRRRIVQEVVVVMPTLGVQLETFYHNKKISRRFVPLQKIVAPVINEAVTPVTCYFYLALLVRGEDDLVLAFQSLRPPLRMLVPIWRSLCEAVEVSSTKQAGPAQDVTAKDRAAI